MSKIYFYSREFWVLRFFGQSMARFDFRAPLIGQYWSICLYFLIVASSLADTLPVFWDVTKTCDVTIFPFVLCVDVLETLGEGPLERAEREKVGCSLHGLPWIVLKITSSVIRHQSYWLHAFFSWALVELVKSSMWDEFLLLCVCHVMCIHSVNPLFYFSYYWLCV